MSNCMHVTKKGHKCTIITDNKYCNAHIRYHLPKWKLKNREYQNSLLSLIINLIANGHRLDLNGESLKDIITIYEGGSMTEFIEQLKAHV